MTHTMSRLGAMMFLQFFIWGAWFVTLGTYLVQGPLQASASQVATAFLSQSIGAIVAPFLVGLIADRYFAAQRILAVLHLAGALLMWLASTATGFLISLSGTRETRSGKATLSNALRCGTSRKSWNTVPMRRRNAGRPLRGKVMTSLPNIRIIPRDGRCAR